MSIDLSPIANSIMPLIQSIFGKVPLGIIVVGIPAALIIALVLASKLVRVVGAQFGFGVPKVSGGGYSSKLVSSGKARVGRVDPLASGTNTGIELDFDEGPFDPDDTFSFAEARIDNQLNMDQSYEDSQKEDKRLAKQQDLLDKALARQMHKAAFDKSLSNEDFKAGVGRLVAARRKNKPPRQ